MKDIRSSLRELKYLNYSFYIAILFGILNGYAVVELISYLTETDLLKQGGIFCCKC